MSTARQGREIVVEVVNKIGVLTDLSKVVSEKGVNILAILGEVDGVNAVVRFVTDDNLRAVDVLRAHRYVPREADVVLVDIPHKPGMLRAITEKLGQAGLDLVRLYATGPTREQHCLVVLSSTDNQRAVVVLNG